MPLNYPVPTNYLGYKVVARNGNFITVSSDKFDDQEWALTVTNIKRDATCRICAKDFKCHQVKMWQPEAKNHLNRFHKICLTCARS